YDFRRKNELDRSYIFLSMLLVDINPDQLSDAWSFYGFRDGYAKIQSKEGMMGYIDEEEKVVVPRKYPWARMHGKNHVLVSEGNYLNSVSVAYFIDTKIGRAHV